MEAVPIRTLSKHTAHTHACWCLGGRNFWVLTKNDSLQLLWACFGSRGISDSSAEGWFIPRLSLKEVRRKLSLPVCEQLCSFEIHLNVIRGPFGFTRTLLEVVFIADLWRLPLCGLQLSTGNWANGDKWIRESARERKALIYPLRLHEQAIIGCCLPIKLTVMTCWMAFTIESLLVSFVLQLFDRLRPSWICPILRYFTYTFSPKRNIVPGFTFLSQEY